MAQYQLQIGSECLSTPPGTALLLLGPALAGKHILINKLIHAGLTQGEACIILCCSHTAEQLLDWFSFQGMDLGPYLDRLRILDPVSIPMNLKPPEHSYVKRLSSPGAITELGIKLNEALQQLMDAGFSKIRVGIHSISSLLMFSELKLVFRLLHMLIPRVRLAGGLLLAGLEPEMHDAQTVNSIMQLFDCLLEFRVMDRRLEFRFSTPGKLGDWISISEAAPAGELGLNRFLKPWGSLLRAQLEELHPGLSLKLLQLDPNRSTSLHYHPSKLEHVLVLRGLVCLELGDGLKYLREWEGISILPMQPHRLLAVRDGALVLEILTGSDDSIRISDPYGRSLGRIQEEA